MTDNSINHTNPFRYGYSLLLDNENGYLNQFIIYPKTYKWQTLIDLLSAGTTD